MSGRVSHFLAIPFAALIAVSLPGVQKVFVPLEGEMDRLIAASEAKPDPEPVVHADVVYKRTLLRAFRLDIYEPLPDAEGAAVAGDGGAGARSYDATPSAGATWTRPPVVLFLHGGSWIHGDKVTIRVIDRFVERMRRAGYFVVAVNYTTSVLRGLAGPLANAEAAVRWVITHADDYGYDVENLGLYGVSAGGHLALMLASTMDVADSHFAFVFAECAPSDLIALRSGEAFEHSANLGMFTDRRLAALSPVRLIHAAMPPVLLFHGGADQVVDVAQSERYYDAVRSAGVTAEFALYPEGDHGFLNLPDEVWYEQETRALRFLEDRFRAHGADG